MSEFHRETAGGWPGTQTIISRKSPWQFTSGVASSFHSLPPPAHPEIHLQQDDLPRGYAHLSSHAVTRRTRPYWQPVPQEGHIRALHLLFLCPQEAQGPEGLQ